MRSVWAYGILLVAAAAFLATLRTDYFANFGFLVVGVVLGIYPAFFIEENRRKREAKTIAISTHYELANRVARCCFDF